MRDPHVVSLSFRLNTSDTFEIRDPKPLRGSELHFDYVLENNTLNVKLRGHYPSKEDAIDLVQPFLDAWELSEALDQRRKSFWFELEDCKIIDRDPPPPGTPQTIQAAVIASGVKIHAIAITSFSVGEYPSPPERMKAVSPVVTSIWTRYLRFKAGGEPLQQLAYYWLSVLREQHDGIAGASRALCIERSVLERVGRDSNNEGDEMEARKRTPKGIRKPLAQVQRDWLESTLLVLIRRKAEFDSNPDQHFDKITMASFNYPEDATT
jgi:hypothetical protein